MYISICRRNVHIHIPPDPYTARPNQYAGSIWYMDMYISICRIYGYVQFFDWVGRYMDRAVYGYVHFFHVCVLTYESVARVASYI